MKAAFARVANIKAFPSTGISRIEIEIPVEFHAKLVSEFFGKDVLVTIPEVGLGAYGVYDGAQDSAPATTDEGGEPEGQEPAGLLANRMHRAGYFRNPRLWRAMERCGIYTQAEHKEFVQQRPCCAPDLAYSGADTFGYGPCGGDVVMHHVRSAANSGTGIKPEHWYGVPLCHNHHQQAHSAAMSREATDTLMVLAINFTAVQVKEAMKSHLGLASLRDITPALVQRFEAEIGL